MKQLGVKILKPHISLNVNNVAESTEFYKKLFGSEPLKYVIGGNRPGYAKFDLDEPLLNLALNETPHSPGGALSHLGIQVETTHDVYRVRERWIAEGLVTQDQMQVDCCYALQDKTWARDPDGNEWEVFVVLEDTEPAEASCECGTTASVDEARAECCNVEQKASTIGAKSAPCC